MERCSLSLRQIAAMVSKIGIIKTAAAYKIETVEISPLLLQSGKTDKINPKV